MSMTRRSVRTIMRTRIARLSTSRSIRVDAGGGRPTARTVWSHLIAVATVCVGWAPAGAHGFGQRYDLPLPLSFYLLGAAAAVILSFVVVGLFARHTPGARGYPRIDLLAHPLGRWLADPVLLALLKLIAAGVFILTVTAGFCGNQDPYR